MTDQASAAEGDVIAEVLDVERIKQRIAAGAFE